MKLIYIQEQRGSESFQNEVQLFIKLFSTVWGASNKTQTKTDLPKDINMR